MWSHRKLAPLFSDMFDLREASALEVMSLIHVQTYYPYVNIQSCWDITIDKILQSSYHARAQAAAEHIEQRLPYILDFDVFPPLLPRR
jgi:hypothetical protein